MTKDGEWCALCDLDRMEADIQKARKPMYPELAATARIKVFLGWSDDEWILLREMFREKFGPNVLPSQVKLKTVDKEGLNPPGPRHF